VSESDDDGTRRTRLAAERTWLAWWRSGIAAATAAVGIGGVVPQLVDGGRTAYIVLGAGYAALAATVFAAAAARRRDVEQALARGEFADLGARGVHVLTIVGMALALGTLAVIVVQP
jgi:putative membrane protein